MLNTLREYRKEESLLISALLLHAKIDRYPIAGSSNLRQSNQIRLFFLHMSFGNKRDNSK